MIPNVGTVAATAEGNISIFFPGSVREPRGSQLRVRGGKKASKIYTSIIYYISPQLQIILLLLLLLPLDKTKDFKTIQ